MERSLYEKLKKGKDGRGKMFRGVRNSKNAPHIYGWIKINGVIYRLSAWFKDFKSWDIIAQEFDESKIVEDPVRDEIGTVEQPPTHLVEPRKEWIP